MIPTAEEFSKEFEGDEGLETRKGILIHENVYKFAIEFAKLHVEAALKAASEKAKIKYEYSGNTGSEYCDEYVDLNSILNAYPESNIK
jgi:hypothetical protein